MEKKVDTLPDDQCILVMQREAKKRREEVEFATQAKREDLREKLKLEISTLNEFLPAQLDAAAIEKILGEMKLRTPALNVSAAMKQLRERYAGQFDGKLASDVAKRIL